MNEREREININFAFVVLSLLIVVAFYRLASRYNEAWYAFYGLWAFAIFTRMIYEFIYVPLRNRSNKSVI